MNLPDFDLQVLKKIASVSIGMSLEQLQSIFGLEIYITLELLQQTGLIKRYEHSIQPFLPPGSDYAEPPINNYLVTANGKLELKRILFNKKLTARQIWIERLWGFISGILLSYITYLITKQM